MMITKLENWAFITDYPSSPYTAPELLECRLEGDIYDDVKHRFSGKTHITTSPVVAFCNNQAKTRSGNIYILGVPSASFLHWLKSQGKNITDYKPFGEVLTDENFNNA